MKTLLLIALLAGSATAATAADCHLDLDQTATARWACGQAAGMGSQDHASVVEATFRPICDDAERFDSIRGRCVACPDREGGTRPFYVDPASGRLLCQIHALEPDRGPSEPVCAPGQGRPRPMRQGVADLVGSRSPGRGRFE